jgi:hypothetical protein
MTSPTKQSITSYVSPFMQQGSQYENGTPKDRNIHQVLPIIRPVLNENYDNL